MSMRRLVEADCGGANPLMQMGGQFSKDAAFQDEGFSGFRQEHRPPNEELVNEFLGQAAAPPQSFQMNNLLQEMREIESRNFHPAVVSGPKVIDQVANDQWAKEYAKMASVPVLSQEPNFNEAWKQNQPISNFQSTSDFFGPQAVAGPSTAGPSTSAFAPMMPMMHNIYQPQMPMSYNPNVQRQLEPIATPQQGQTNVENWFDEFEKSKVEEAQKTENYNDKFWEKLQNEWQKMAEDGDIDHPWLSEFSDLYDPYKVYTFQENNVMDNIENALERGKEFLKKGDLPTAVLCFEVAAKQQPENAEVWELLGMTQAENEMDPLAIAALKKSHELQPDNLKVLMALAVSYTNESLQSQALKMMSLWLQNNPKYKAFINPADIQNTEEIASSLIRAHDLKEVQNMFLEVVQKTANQVDPDIQEALGVLFNLSSEYDKAVDCFQAALNVSPNNAKLWNRLGASLANGSRSVEAVEAYQRALELEPGFIRVRYNVGICCMNLKAYNEAAEHLLTALNLQATSSERSGLDVTKDKKQQMSNSIWSTLKMIISLMGRNDLHELVNNRDVEQLNKALGF